MPRSVVLCSYGPKKSTHQSLRRLRAMLAADDQLLVYAGTRAGVADGGKTTDVEVIEERGREGLLQALDRVRHETVMHLTDGVTVTAGAVGKLFAAAERTGKLVTPWTNDVGTDHYVGALPVHGNTIQVLSERGRAQPEAEVRVLRPICVVGSLRQVLGLVPHHLSYPTTIMRLVYEDCIAVAGAVAAHDGSAETRMLPPEGPDGRPLLVASMIVRDEEDFLADCLRSLDGLVDRIDVCDTGSVDRTIEIAREFGANVIEREWRDDFGWARNEALEMGRDAWWSLWIDADERIVVEDVERIRRELATAIDHFDGFNITVSADRDESVPDSEEDLSRWTTTRILRPDTMEYVGALHEQVLLRTTGQQGLSVALEGIEIVHLGYTSQVIEARDKTARNLRIAKAGYEDHPDDPTAALHYARSLWLARSSPEERLAPLEQAHDGFVGADDRNRAYVKGLLAKNLHEMGEKERAWDIAADALDLVPAEDTAFHVLLAAGRSLGRTDEVLARADTYAHGPSLRPVMEDPKTRSTNRAEVVRMLREAGRVEDALRHTGELLAESQSAFPHWELLIDGLLEELSPDEFVTRVGHLLTEVDDGGWARPLATRIRRDIALGLIEAHLEAGGRTPEPVRVGLTLAMLLEDDAALQRLARGSGHLLPMADRSAMAARLRERGQTRAADLLAPEPEAREPEESPGFLL